MNAKTGQRLNAALVGINFGAVTDHKDFELRDFHGCFSFQR
jgi:hypothetical protein